MIGLQLILSSLLLSHTFFFQFHNDDLSIFLVRSVDIATFIEQDPNKLMSFCEIHDR